MVANSSADSSQIKPLFAVLLLEPSPRVTIKPWSTEVPVLPCPYLTKGSAIVRLVLELVVVSPLTTRLATDSVPELGLYTNADVSSNSPFDSLLKTTGKFVLAVLSVTTAVVATAAVPE